MGAHVAPSPAGHGRTQVIRFVRIFAAALAPGLMALYASGGLGFTSTSLTAVAALVPAAAEVALRQFRKTSPVTAATPGV